MARARSPNKRLRNGLRISASYERITSCMPEAWAWFEGASPLGAAALGPAVSGLLSVPALVNPGLSFSKASNIRARDLRSDSYS